MLIEKEPLIKKADEIIDGKSVNPAWDIAKAIITAPEVESVPLDPIATFLAGYAMPPDAAVQGNGGYKAMTDPDKRKQAWKEYLRAMMQEGT